MASFDDILYQADKLAARLRKEDESSDLVKSGSVSSFDAALGEVFRRCEKLWQKKRPFDERNAELQASMLLGEQGFSLGSLPGCSSRSDAAPAEESDVADEAAGVECAPVLKEIVEESSRRAMAEAERAFFNSRILEETLFDASAFARSEFGKQPSPSKIRVDRNVIVPSTAVELAFAKTLSEYVVDGNVAKLEEGFLHAVTRCRSRDVSSIWQLVTAMISGCPAAAVDAEYRSSDAYFKFVVDAAVSFLDRDFVSHMEEIVGKNLLIARRGGVPGTLPLIEAYLNVKHAGEVRTRLLDSEPFGENSHSVWEVLFHSLRAGAFDAAAQVASSHLQNRPTSAALSAVITSLHSSKKLTVEMLSRLEGEWKCARKDSSGDSVYRVAVYGALLGEDVPQMSDNVENWLWMKLFSMKLRPNFPPALFHAFQRLICYDYGDEYFTSNGGSVSTYVRVLLITGQQERAIYTLFRSGMIEHAVHIAIIAFVKGLLVVADDVTKPLLVSPESSPVKCSLNFARLILLYVKSFECSDASRFLDYCFLLNGMKSLNGGNLFAACVSRVVYVGDEGARVLGELDERGIRHEGLIDKFASRVQIEDLIAKVALDSEVNGDFEKAVRIYYAAERYGDSLRVMCECLARELLDHRLKSSTRALAVWLAALCKRCPAKFPAERLASLFLLVDICTFFRCFHEQRFSQCIDILSKLKCVPLDPDEVPSFVALSQLLDDQVRSVIPDVCLAAMQIFAEEASRNPNSVERIRRRAEAIVVYAAAVPYRFSSEIAAQILRLSIQIN